MRNAIPIVRGCGIVLVAIALLLLSTPSIAFADTGTAEAQRLEGARETFLSRAIALAGIEDIERIDQAPAIMTPEGRDYVTAIGIWLVTTNDGELIPVTVAHVADVTGRDDHVAVGRLELDPLTQQGLLVGDYWTLSQPDPGSPVATEHLGVDVGEVLSSFELASGQVASGPGDVLCSVGWGVIVTLAGFNPIIALLSGAVVCAYSAAGDSIYWSNFLNPRDSEQVQSWPWGGDIFAVANYDLLEHQCHPQYSRCREIDLGDPPPAKTITWRVDVLWPDGTFETFFHSHDYSAGGPSPHQRETVQSQVPGPTLCPPM